MDKAEEFLDCYRLLEEELCRKYNIDDKTFGSPIVRFINDKEGKNYKERLNLCREIRNLLTHHAEFDGEPIIVPSSSMTEFLKEVTQYIKQPPKAIHFATLYTDILKTSPTQKAQIVMRKMQRLGFSHVPVIDQGEFVGVFSMNTIFTYALHTGMSSLSDDMLIGAFAELLPPDKHENERFCFFSENATLFEIKNEFNKKMQRNRRLAVVFITDNGSFGGRILGMLTPWDVINV